MQPFRGGASQGNGEGVTGEVRREGEKLGQCGGTEPTGRGCFIEVSS